MARKEDTVVVYEKGTFFGYEPSLNQVLCALADHALLDHCNNATGHQQYHLDDISADSALTHGQVHQHQIQNILSKAELTTQIFTREPPLKE